MRYPIAVGQGWSRRARSDGTWATCRDRRDGAGGID